MARTVSLAPAEKHGRGSLHYEHIARNILSGVAVAFVTIAYCLSFSALIFSGPFADGLGYGITAALTSAGVACLIVSRLSSIGVAVACPDTPPVAVIAAMAFALGSSIGASQGSSQALGTLVTAIALTTLLTGICLFAIGYLRLATWMRFIPYPVIAGFLAASGWFLLTGAYRVATGVELDFNGVEAAFSARNLPLWGTSLAFAGLLFLVRRATTSPFAVPIALFAALLLVVLIAEFGGVPASEIQAQGWLMGVPATSMPSLPWTAIAPSDSVSATAISVVRDLEVLIPYLPEMSAVALVTAMAILLNATGIEVAERITVDLDAEMRASGLANIVAATGGGLVANLTYNRSRLNLSAGATNRLSAAICGLTCLVVLFGGLDMIGYVAAPILGGLLFYLGVFAIWTWVVRQYRQLEWADTLLILAIFLLIIRFGYLAGAALGVVASCLFFAFTYSRVPSIRRELSRRTYASYVERSKEHNQVLRDQGDRIRILKLQGYIFFGTANRLVQYINSLSENRTSSDKYWIIIDFENVTGVDSSARFSFVHLFQMAEKSGFEIILATTPKDVCGVFRQESLLISEGDRRNDFEALDLALEQCEQDLLADLEVADQDSVKLAQWLSREVGDEDTADQLARHMRRRECHPGEMLCTQGDAADSFFLVASGRLSIFLECPPLEPIRLRSTLGHTTIGEMGFYRGAKRSASVRVEEPAIVYELTRDAFEMMVEQSPSVANALNVFIIRTLSDRLTAASDEIGALKR
ncbi:MAG: SulP family inorganic anion transporter [Pseudomonadota bacterium]